MFAFGVDGSHRTQKGGIYRHFANKEELAVAAFDYAWKEASRARFAALDRSLDGVLRLKQLISNFVEHRGPIPGGCPVLNTAIDSDDGNPLLRARVTKALRSWRAYLQRTVKKAESRGELRSGIDPKTVATVLIASLEGALMISRIERTDDALRRIRQHLNHYLDTAVATDPLSSTTDPPAPSLRRSS